MQILKVLNNSLILAIDSTGNECILMGKGIGYNKSIGNTLNETDIEKIFLLKDKSTLKNFIQLASEIEDIYFHLSKEIIRFAFEKYSIEVMDYLYLSLSDHISFTVHRFNQGYLEEKFNYTEIIKFHKEEYDIGKFGIELINKTFNISLPDSDATSIGFHFVNAKLNSPTIQKEQDIFKLVKDIETITCRTLNMTFDRESFSYIRFITHLNYFAKRLIENNLFEDNSSDFLYSSIKKNMDSEDTVINNINHYIKNKFDVELSQQEKIYLLIHLHRILSDIKDLSL